MPVFDKKKSEPLYLQLYDYLKQEIRMGVFQKGAKLPSKRSLAAHLQIAENTVCSAYEQLVAEGYLFAMERSGYFVSQIDNLVQIEAHEPGEIVVPEKKAKTKEYDFAYRGVDKEDFPYVLWRKIFREVINEYDDELLESGHPQGNELLRAEIARYLRRSRGVHCTAEQIIVSAGTEILVELLLKLLPEKSVFGLENPGSERLYKIMQYNKIRFIPLGLDSDGLRPDKVYSSEANTLFITPSHQFPTGEIMPISRRIELLNWANESQGRYIIEDDYDSEFRYGGRPIPSLQGLSRGGSVIYLGSFSKSLAPGLRISYLVLPRSLLEVYHNGPNYFTCPVATMVQKALAAFIGGGHFERHLNKMRNIYKRKRELLVTGLREIDADFEICGADAGLHLVLEFAPGPTEVELVEKAAKKGVRVYPLSAYHYLPETEQGVRILLGFATMEDKKLSDALLRLDAAWGGK